MAGLFDTGRGLKPSLFSASRPSGTDTWSGAFPEQEQESMLRRLGGSVLGGLEMAANVLDTPGSMLRAALTGNNPLMAAIDTDSRISGKELLQTWGVLDQNSSGILPWMAGLATEIVADPLLPLTGPMKAITKQGLAAGLGKGAIRRAAKGPGSLKLSANALAKGGGARMVEEIAEGNRALFGYKVPFAKNPLFTFGTGETAANIAKRVTYSNPFSNALREMFTNNTVTRGLSQVPSGKWWGDGHFLADQQMASMIDETSSFLDSAAHTTRTIEEATGTYEHLMKNFLIGAKQLHMSDPEKYPDIVGNILGKGVDPANLTLDDFLRATAESSPVSTTIDNVTPTGFQSGVAATDMVQAAMQHGVLQDLLADQAFMGSLKNNVVGTINAQTFADAAYAFDGIVNDMLTWKDTIQLKLNNMGLSIKELQDVSDHFPRRATAELRGDLKKGGQWFRAFSSKGLAASGYSIMRKKALRDIPGKTHVLNQMTKDPNLTAKLTLGANGAPLSKSNFRHLPAGDKLTRAKYTIDHYGLDLNTATPTGEKIVGNPFTDSDIYDLFSQPQDVFQQAMADFKPAELKQLARHPYMKEMMGRLNYLHNLPITDPASLATLRQRGLFGMGTVSDLNEYVVGGLNRLAAMHMVHNVLAQTADAANTGPTVYEVLGGKGMKFTESALEYFRKNTGMDPTAVRVPEDVPKAIKVMMDHHQKPETLSTITKVYRQYTDWIKGGWTTPAPAFHNRNRLSGNYVNAVKMMDWSDPAGVLEDMKSAYMVAQGIPVQAPGGHGDGLMAAIAYRLFPEGGLRTSDVFTYIHQNPATKATIGELGSKIIPPLGGLSAAPGLGTIATTVRHMTNMTRGVATEVSDAVARSDFSGVIPALKSVGDIGVRAPLKGAIEGGTNTMRMVEVQNRLEAFFNLLRQGWEPAAAAQYVTKHHYDYSDLDKAGSANPFLRKLIPFYGWLRNNTPRQLANLLEAPGGPEAQTIRALSTTSESLQEGGNESFVPSWLRERVTFPLQSKDKTTARFLNMSGFLPIEDALNQVSFRRSPSGTGLGMPRPDIARTSQKLLSRFNPVPLWLVETGTQTDLFTGRPHSELYPTPTRHRSINTLLHFSPLARLVSTMRQSLPSVIGQPIEDLTGFELHDERKADYARFINFLMGGIKVTDIDRERGIVLEGRKVIEDLLSGEAPFRSFSRVGLPPDKAMEMTPEQIRLYSLYNYLAKRSREFSPNLPRPTPSQVISEVMP